MPDLRLVNTPGTGALIYGDQGSGTRATADFITFEKNDTEVFSVNYLGLPDPGGQQAIWQHQVQIGDIAADSDSESWFLMEVRGTITITKVEYCVDTQTADGTSNRQTLLIEDESSNSIVSIDTPTASPSVAQATWTTMGGVSSGTLTAGDYLTFSPTLIGSGLIMSGLTFLFTYTMGT